MRRAAATLVLSLSLIGCGYAAPSVNIAQDLNDNKNCVPEKFLTGELTDVVAFATQEEGLRALIWPSSFRITWAPGFIGHWEVRNDQGVIVARSGGRYRIGGVEFVAAGNAFWACGPITPA